MKKTALILFLCILLSVCLTACGGEVSAKKPLEDIYEEIEAQVSFASVLRLDGESLKPYLGIDEALCKQYVALIPENVVSGDMLFLFEGADSDAAAKIEEKLNGYRDQKAAEMKDYIPAEYDKIQKGSVTRKGSFVWLVVSAELSKIESIIKDNIK